MRKQIKTPKTEFEVIVCAGGIDQITPTLSLKNGVARDATNFEIGVNGGYSLIAGYERFDGKPSPSEGKTSDLYITLSSPGAAPSAGATVTSSSGGAGVVCYLNWPSIGVAFVSGTFAVGDVVTVSSVDVGTISSTGEFDSIETSVAFQSAVANTYRDDIDAVPGSGPVRGVVVYNDLVYAFRDASDLLSCKVYKSSSSGWVEVSLNNKVLFSAGTTAPIEGATLVQGSVSATVLRVARNGGAWTGDATGILVIGAPSGGHFSAGSATIGTTTLTLGGAESAITLAPGGKFDLVVGNIGGQQATTRIYGAYGQGKAFEFDGTVLVPISTGATVDKPTHCLLHRGFLWLSQGSSVMYSVAGEPYNFSGLLGAGEVAVGEDVTGLVTMPGGTTTGTLGIFSRSSTFILYGNSASDFNLVAYNTGTGANAFTVQNMAQTLAFDDRGVNSIQASLQYGNFSQGSLTQSIYPFIAEKIGKCTCATLCRKKSQYRVFFDDGYAIYITIINGESKGTMIIKTPDIAYCATESKYSDGQDVMFFGGADGYVYQLDKGTSFDGDNIEFNLTLNYSSAKSPRVLKTYRKSSVEVWSIENLSDINMNIGYSIGYDSENYIQQYSTAFNKSLAGVKWDNFVWDNFFWDAKSGGPIDVPMSGNAENFALTFSGSSSSISPFLINSVIVHYTLRRPMY